MGGGHTAPPVLALTRRDWMGQKREEGMTYLQFLVIFLGLPIIAVLVALRGRVPRWYWLNMAALCALVLVYTAPWDNLIVVNGVWSYGSRQVLGLVIGVVPLEEYLFYLLQVILTGLCCLWLVRRLERPRRP